MARSYPPRRFPAGPYLEPTVSPAMRGPKRTGPIGAIVPGDDIEVARELARKPRPPRKEPIVVHVKLGSDGTAGDVLLVGDIFSFLVSQDMDQVNVIAVELYCTTVSSSGATVVQLRRQFAQTFDANGDPETPPADVDVLEEPLQIDEGTFYSEDSVAPYRIDLTYNTLDAGDLLWVELVSIGSDVKGLGIVLTFK